MSKIYTSRKLVFDDGNFGMQTAPQLREGYALWLSASTLYDAYDHIDANTKICYILQDTDYSYIMMQIGLEIMINKSLFLAFVFSLEIRLTLEALKAKASCQVQHRHRVSCHGYRYNQCYLGRTLVGGDE